MYNEALKAKYIEQKKNISTFNEKQIIGIFNRCEPYEKIAGKDLCNFSTTQIENMFRTMGFVSADSLCVFSSILSTYSSWCLGNGLIEDSQNHYTEMNNRRLYEMINLTQFDLKIVERNEVVNWCSKLNYSMGKVVLLGLFEGICGINFENLLGLTIDDLDMDNNRVRIEGDWIGISRELANFMEQSYEEDFYYSYDSERKVNFIKSNLIIKERSNTSSTSSEFRKGRRVYFELKRIFKQLGVEKWMTAKALVVSGQIHFIKEESAKRGIAPKEYISKYKKEIEGRYHRRFDSSRFLYSYERYL